MVNMLSPTPELNGTGLTVDLAVKQPTRIANRIAALTVDQLILDKFFRPLGAKVTGGGLVYSVLKASDLFTTMVKQRGAGDEYEMVNADRPEPKLAKPEDWGGKFALTDEQILRNDTLYVDQQVTQLSNTIAHLLDVRAMQVLGAAITGENMVPGHDWSDLTFVGPDVDLTPSRERPTADFAAAQLASSLQELGITHDALVVHPQEAAALRTAYEAGLDAMLKSAGLAMFENARVFEGTAWVAQRGQAGVVGFETPLTVETWRDPHKRTTYVQAYAVPAFAVEKPYAVKFLTGLAG